ncbi:dual specificity protein kinase TTK isoform X2 [Ochlerotatus camptorhynchus]|uniref:dual specificity protein kinase TTK isoform X2 n=1 Tax=Ochlerotatus camptorhynchus TaxID=644619 RepID=UPI0031D85B73
MSVFHPKRLTDGHEIEQQMDQDGQDSGDILLQTSGTGTLANVSCRFDSSEERSPRHRSTRSFQPKRVSELPPLESESDSDDENNLNCAILNDSFLLTPSKCPDDMDSVDKAPKSVAIPTQKENVHARQRLEDRLISTAGPEPHEMKVLKRVPLLDRCQFSLLNQNDSKCSKTRDSGISSTTSSVLSAVEQPVTEIGIKPTNKDEVDEAELGKSLREQKIQSPSKDHLFVTPRDKFPRSHARGISSRVISSTAGRSKSRTTLEDEFKSQKILFATPLATGLSRLPVNANDSLSLSLVDTPIKSKDRPLSPIVEQQQPVRATKRSTDELFPATPGPEKRLSPEPVPHPSKDVPPVAAEEKRTTEQQQQQQTKPLPVIAINGKEYQVLKKLGSGGSSSVFLAKQVGTGVECALKLVNLEGDASLVEGYINETKLLAKLQGNENVVALYDYCHLPEANQLFLVMEKGDSDLHKFLQNYQKDIPLYTLMQIWYQMVQCVHYIHEHGVIHLDLKPANFLMVKGRLKLIDFGIASNIAFDSTSIMKFSQAGTFNYISPEALIDTETSPSNSQPKIKMSKKSDIWSLGCILYLLLYKKTPFAHIKNIHNKVNTITNPNTVIEYPPLPMYYPAMLLEMLQRCLKYDAKARASTTELLQYPFDMVIPIGTK